MWKEFSKSYIKVNRASGLSIIIAAFIAALFLSLLCNLLYNAWSYELNQIEREEGAWQARISGDLCEADLSVIRQFTNVERAVINEALSDQEVIVDIYLHDLRTIYQDMPMIAEKLGLDKDAIQYHSLLLSRFLINDPEDKEPPMLLPFYMAIVLVVSISLILIIRNSFEISMHARIHQFGILSSIGATPKQIRICLLQEAGMLCLLPILIGTACGAALCYGAMETVNFFAADVVGRLDAKFRLHPVVFIVTVLSAALTVFFSAWIPARKLSKMSPLEAIRNSKDLQLRRRKRFALLSWLFGIKGEMVGNVLKAQRKALRISTVSLLLSYLGFTIILCFFTLSEISTRYTYFERYQDSWDIMVTVKNTRLAEYPLTEKVKSIPGVQSAILYQKAEEYSRIAGDWQSDELLALGGVEAVAGADVVREGSNYRIASPIIIMDDSSFLEYCKQIGATPNPEGIVILNQIWDSMNSNFREKQFIPMIKEDKNRISLVTKEQAQVEIPILAYTKEPPVLREEYDNNTLVQFMPLTIWNKIAGQMSSEEQTIYIRILAQDRSELKELNRLEEAIIQLMGTDYDIVCENRIQEKRSNDRVIQGFKLILGAFCGLLAMIGITNVFSNTLGFLRQRKREFAQYLSVGMTPADLRKMFFIEAFVIAGRPIFITLPLTIGGVTFMTNASHLDPMVFWREAPILPILLFALLIVAFVSLAYFMGGRRMLQYNLVEALKNDAEN
jgi:putative ABC transport system permease protein